jgi:hypothetical protein
MRRVLFLLLLAGCKETNTIHLAFGAAAAASTVRTPVGFRCKDDAGKFLPTRAVGAGRMFHVSVLIDFVDLGGGLPTCRPSDIARWCTDHACTPITDDPVHDRVCFDFDQQLGATDAVKAMGDVLDQLDGRPVTDDAPQQPVIIRAVATAQHCSDFTAPTTGFDTTQLVGCAMSCPVQLASVSGDVLLDLPTLSDMCEASVVACAQATLKQ